MNWTGSQFLFTSDGFFRATLFIGSAFGNEFIFELRDKTLHRPRAGFAEGANRLTARNIVGDLHEIIRVALAAFTVGETMERLAHPKRAFAAGRALAAAFVGVKFADVRERLDDVHGVIHHDDGAGTGHRAGGGERVEVVR